MFPDGEQIQITHFINPSRFFCRVLSQNDEEFQQTAEIEDKLKKLSKKQNPEINKYWQPKTNSVNIRFE